VRIKLQIFVDHQLSAWFKCPFQRLFALSEMTIRRDLIDLEKQGLLTRVHGGAQIHIFPIYRAEQG